MLTRYTDSSIHSLGYRFGSVHYGIGRHTFYLEPAQLIQAVKWEKISQLPWVISIMFTRLSTSVFLYRIFATKKAWKWALYPIIVFNFIGSLASFITILPQCSPVEKNWNPIIPGSCWHPRTQIDIGLFQGGISIRPKHYTHEINI